MQRGPRPGPGTLGPRWGAGCTGQGESRRAGGRLGQRRAGPRASRGLGEHGARTGPLSLQESRVGAQRAIGRTGSPPPAPQVYKGYVDDPRNTDNAWMEAVAVSIHFPDQSDVDLKRLNSV